MGRITWSYIWRLIAWQVITAIVFGFIFSLILSSTSGLNLLSSPESIISYYKKNLIGTLVISFIITVIACKLATAEIQKVFIINSDNVNQVFKRIVIVFTIIYIMFNLSNIQKIQNTVESLNSLSIDTKLLENFGKFGIAFSVISVILNSLEMLLMILFEKKLLKIQ